MRTLHASLLAVLTLLVLACAPAPPSASPEASLPGATPGVSAAPEPTGSAAPSAPTEGVAVPADIRYRCGDGPPFSLDILDDPSTAELDGHPSAQVLRDAIATPPQEFEWMPSSGYRLVSRDGVTAEFIAHLPGNDPPFADVTVQFQDGRWQLAGWGQCRPRIALDGLSPASWTLDPDAPAPDAATTDLPILVNELACTGGQEMGARLLPPTILEQEDAVLIVFAATPLEGDAFECPGNPSTRVVVRLSAPLGDRVLRDAGTFPPLDPAAAPF